MDPPRLALETSSAHRDDPAPEEIDAALARASSEDGDFAILSRPDGAFVQLGGTCLEYGKDGRVWRHDGFDDPREAFARFARGEDPRASGPPWREVTEELSSGGPTGIRRWILVAPVVAGGLLLWALFGRGNREGGSEEGVLEEPGAFFVTALDTAGNRVEGAQVAVRDSGREWAHTSEPQRTVAHGTTDDRGVVGLLNLDPGQAYRLQMTPPSDREDLASVDVAQWWPARETVRFTPGFTVTGVVQDPLGRSLGDVTVTRLLTVGRSGAISDEDPETAPDANGQFRFPHAPRGPAYLRSVRHDPSGGEHDAALAVATPQHPRVEIALARDDEDAQLELRVENAVPEMEAYFIPAPWFVGTGGLPTGPPTEVQEGGWLLEGDGPIRIVFAGGRYRVLLGERDRTHRVEFGADGLLRLPPSLELATQALWIPPTSPDSDLSLYVPEVGFRPEAPPLRRRPGRTIHVRLKGAVPPRAEVRVHAEGPGRVRLPGSPRADGEWRLLGLPEGRWRVLVEVDVDGALVRRGFAWVEAGASKVDVALE